MRLARFLRYLHQHFAVAEVELTAWPPFVRIKFKREEVLSLTQVQDRIRAVLIHQFIRRQVMWLDLTKEAYDPTIGSLKDATEQLDREAAALKAVAEPSHQGLSKLLTSWATACMMTRKNLMTRWDEIAKEKAEVLGYDSAGEDRTEALHEALIELRQTAYPIVYALIEVLLDTDSDKQEALRLWNQGTQYLQDVTKARGIVPEWDEVEPVGSPSA